MRALIAILILGLCGCQTELKLSDDTELQEIFSPSELAELGTLLSDFDKLVLTVTGSSNIQTGYVKFSNELKYGSETTDWKRIDEAVTVFAQKKLIELKDKPVFDSLWALKGGHYGKQLERRVAAAPKAFDSKYVEFLDHCINEDDRLGFYKDQVQKAGSVSVTLFHGFPIVIRELKLRKDCIRLLIAIHFICTRGEQLYDKEIHGDLDFPKVRSTPDGKSIFEQFFGEPTDEKEK